MLVLSRKVSEEIILDLSDWDPSQGSIISVMNVEAARGKARLGVKAPKSVKIHRDEVYEAIQASEHKDPETTAA